VLLEVRRWEVEFKSSCSNLKMGREVVTILRGSLAMKDVGSRRHGFYKKSLAYYYIKATVFLLSARSF
jgi:hypothetical protein